MSHLAKLLNIKGATERPKENGRGTAGSLWKRLFDMLRAVKVQRRVRRLEVIERIALGNKQSVALVRMDNREFVVGCCGESIVLLVSPQGDPVKAKSARRKRIKSRAPQSAALAAVQVDSMIRTEGVVSSQLPIKAKVADQPLKTRVPSKAHLLKAFAGRAR